MNTCFKLAATILSFNRFIYRTSDRLQNIFLKSKKLSKIGQDQKTLTYAFAELLAAGFKGLLMWGGLGETVSLSRFEIFQYFPIFENFLRP